ncbi:MAG TPA: hypothetical protein VMH20_18825 [Verrucomicrobiae bacterium]|nr:hypothetical protein [Verrucomicrobiae bacterium]
MDCAPAPFASSAQAGLPHSEELQGGVCHVRGRRSRRESAIDDLIHGVDRFPFTGTATNDEDAGDELEVILVSGRFAVHLGILT